MSWIERFRKMVPKPFKFIQKQLDIQQQWTAFKANIRPHRYKIRLLLVVITFPIYKPYLIQGANRLKSKASSYLQEQSTPDKAPFQWLQNFLKQLLDHIFTDSHLKAEALQFVFSLINDEKFVSQILELLVSALKSQQFLNQLKGTLKQIIIDQFKDEQVRSSLKELIIAVTSDQKVKNGLIQLVQQVFSSSQSVDTIVSLLKKGITNDQVKGALADAVNFSVREVLSDEETLDQLKIFIFFLLRKFQSDDEIKGMMDILFAKGLGLVKKKKDSELQKVLRPKKSDLIT